MMLHRNHIALVPALLITFLPRSATAQPSLPCSSSGLIIQSFELDIGASDDNVVSTNGLYLYNVPTGGVADRALVDGYQVRKLEDIHSGRRDSVNMLNIRLPASALDSSIGLSENVPFEGVPDASAILSLHYKDVINESDTETSSTKLTLSRPNISTRLNYSSDDGDDLEWNILGGFGGSDDSLWKTESYFIENTEWNTLRAIDDNGTAYFQFRINYPNQYRVTPANTNGFLFDGADLPINHMSLVFVDPECLRAERDTRREERGHVRYDYLPVNSSGLLPQSSDFVVYTRNYLSKIYANTIPTAQELLSSGDTISTFEIAGEQEPITFSIYAIEDLSELAISTTDLKSGFHTIDAANVQIDQVVTMDKRWRSGRSRHYGENPWYLVDGTSLSISAGTSRQIWVTIDVPESTPSGEYAGTLTLTQASGVPGEFDVDLSMQVMNFPLEGPDAVTYLWHSPLLANRHYSKPRSQAAHNMAEHSLIPMPYIHVIDEPVSCDVPDLNMDAAYDEFEFLHTNGLLSEDTRVFMHGISVARLGNILWSKCYGKRTFLDGQPSPEFDAHVSDLLFELASAILHPPGDPKWDIIDTLEISFNPYFPDDTFGGV